MKEWREKEGKGDRRKKKEAERRRKGKGRRAKRKERICYREKGRRGGEGERGVKESGE